MAKRTFSFSLDDETDADLITWLNQQLNRSAAIRDALRAARTQPAGDVTLTDVMYAVRQLEQTMREIGTPASLPATAARDAWHEDPDAAAALDSLARL